MCFFAVETVQNKQINDAGSNGNNETLIDVTHRVHNQGRIFNIDFHRMNVFLSFEKYCKRSDKQANPYTATMLDMDKYDIIHLKCRSTASQINYRTRQLRNFNLSKQSCREICWRELK